MSKMSKVKKFSETEKKIIEEYIKGLKPREIARKLKVSVRTVYKATWKYRKSTKAIGSGTSSKERHDLYDKKLDTIIMLLEKIEEELTHLNNSVNALSVGFSLKSFKDTEKREDLPSFLKDNPWIEVLRMRGREI